MGGYGSPDDDATQAQTLNDNAIEEARSKLPNPNKEYLECVDCGEEIPEARRRAIKGCPRCVGCQEIVDKRPRSKIKMLDRLT
jgi:phage/conjugal plasmid C-4 type zinc finger TraR family protein